MSTKKNKKDKPKPKPAPKPADSEQAQTLDDPNTGIGPGGDRPPTKPPIP